MALRGGSFNSPVGAGRDGAGPAVSFALPPLQPVPPLPGMPPLQIQLPPMPPVVPGMPPPGPLSAPQTPAPEQEPDDGADPFRTNWLAMLDNALAADIVLLCGPDGDRVPCHRTVLLAQSAHFRNRFATSLLPDRIELPELPTPGVKIFLRFLYSGLPSSLHCFRDPLLAVDTLLVLEFFARDESNLTRFKEARKAVETQLIDAMPSQNAPRALARLNRYGMRSTFDHLLPAYLLHARSDPSRILSLLEGLDYRSFLAAVKSAEWKNEMQKFRIIRAWCGVNGASDDEKAELGGCVELERVTLDELEKEVEPSGLIPVSKLMKQYTAVARRLRAQQGLTPQGGPQPPSLRQQILGSSSSSTDVVNASGMPPQQAVGGVQLPQLPQLPPPQLFIQPPPNLPIMPQSSNGLLNNGQPMNLVPLANGQTAVVGQNGVVMNSLAPGSVALPAVPIQNSQGGGQTDAGIQATLTANAARDRDRDRRPRRRGSNPRVDDIPSAPAAPVPPPGSGATGNGDIASGFENWVVPRGDVSVTRQNAVFNSDSVRSLRSSVALTRGQWRWVIMIERASPRAGNAFYPDVGIMIGEQFDARMPLRAQPNCCAWDGRDSICVNSMPIPYPRSRGGPLKDGEVIVVDLDLDARTLGFRRNGVDCGTSIRGFPGNVYLAICGKYPTRIRWVGLSHVS